MTAFCLTAHEQGWVVEGGNYGELENFTSLRKGDINLIVTEREQFYKHFKVASALCKRLNLLAKGDRIAVFQAVLYRAILEDGR